MKPEFWADEKLAPLPPITRLVYVGLWSMADDRGRIVDAIKQIDAFLFPFTEDTAAPSLDTLVELGRLRRGVTSSGQRIIEIVTWGRHQRIDKPNLRACLPAVVGDESATRRRHVGDEASNHTYDLLPTTNYQLPNNTGESVDMGGGADRAKIAQEAFEAAWGLYPRRSGGNSRQGAYRAFQARLREGVEAAALVAGVERYAAYCVATGAVGSRYVKQGATFFGPDRHWAEAWLVPDAPKRDAGRVRPSDDPSNAEYL